MCRGHLGPYGPSCSATPAPETLRTTDPGQESRRLSPDKAAPRSADHSNLSPAKDEEGVAGVEPEPSTFLPSTADLWRRRGEPPEGGVWYSAYPGASPPPHLGIVPHPLEALTADGTCCPACDCPSQAGQWACQYFPPGIPEPGLEDGGCSCDFHLDCLTAGVTIYSA